MSFKISAALPLLSAVLAAAAFSCAAAGTLAPNAPPEELLGLIAPPPEVVVMERTVFVPTDDSEPARPTAGIEAVRESNEADIRPPQEFSYAATVYDYRRDWAYEVFTRPLRITDITLEPGERVVEAPFVSDSERWVLGAGVSVENGMQLQHVYVKPVASGQEATLIINTDRRAYHLILRSFNTLHMPMVRWRHPAAMPMNLAPQPSAGRTSPEADAFAGGVAVDPRFLSFNYRISTSLLTRRPLWTPEMVLDDGRSTYIVFPGAALHREFPAIFANRRDVVNFRVDGRVAVVDGLWETLTVSSGRARITITKTRARR